MSYETEQTFAVEVRTECDSIATMLIEKNKAYGNSVLDPVRVFSKADITEQIKVRLDDKLSRLQKGDASYNNEDVVRDIIGYLIILLVAEKMVKK